MSFDGDSAAFQGRSVRCGIAADVIYRVLEVELNLLVKYFNAVLRNALAVGLVLAEVCAKCRHSQFLARAILTVLRGE